MIVELLAGITTKLAGLGIATKAGMGLGVAAVSVTGAGAGGVLPGPVQDAVAGVVATATPFTFPESANPKASVGAGVSADATGAADGVPGVDGKSIAEAVKAGAGAGAVEANTGSTGLGRANETPAAGKVPTSLPVPGASAGLSTAAETPAAGKVPASVPPAGAQASVGIDTAKDTPAAGRIPVNVPGRP